MTEATVFDWSDTTYEGRAGRAFCFTLHGYTAADIAVLKQWKYEYMTFGKEIAPTTLSPHLQGYVYFASQKTWSAVLKYAHKTLGHKRLNFRTANGTVDQNQEYCQKEDPDFFEGGVKPKSQAEKGAMEIQAFSDAIELTKTNQIHLIRPDILVRHLKSLRYVVKQLAAAAEPEPEYLEGDRGDHNEWHFGPKNCGKSYYCDYQQTGAVYKPAVKLQYWGRYKGEPNVHLSDITKQSVFENMQLLKNLGEQGPVTVEVKNEDDRLIRPQKVLVTTNEDPRKYLRGLDGEALLSRFRLYEWKHMRGTPEWAPPVGLVIPNPQGQPTKKRPRENDA